MKSKFLLITALLFFVLFGCKEKEVDLSSQPGDEEVNNEVKEKPRKVNRIKATVTYQGLGVMDAAEDGTWLKSVDMGETVFIIGEIPEEKGNWRPVEIELQDSDKTTGFANAWFVIPESKPAVTTTEAKIFSEPKTTKMTKNKIPEMHIIAVADEAYKDNYAKVNYSLGGYAKTECYLSSDDFSTIEDDVKAVRLFNLAKQEKDEEMQVAFLEEAAKIGSPTFGSKIDELLVRAQNGETLNDILNGESDKDSGDDSEIMMEDESDN